jgi:hypothetical protein
MIIGASAIGQFPNQAAGLPVRIGGKSATVLVRPTHAARSDLRPRHAPRVKRLPRT